MVNVKDAIVSQPPQLPHVNGLTVNGSGSNPGAHSVGLNYFVTPTRAGDLVIPAFNIRTSEGQTLHAGPITLHVVAR